jgi:hypothetical protein
MAAETDTPTTTAAQDNWVEICQSLRAKLAKSVEMAEAMNPGELSSLAAAIDNAMWNEMKALSFDQALEERLRTM